MLFVGQIDLEPLFGEKKMAYIFILHPIDEDDTFFDPDMLEWEGENAVIIQPGGELGSHYTVKAIAEGPAVFDKEGKHYEFIPTLQEGFDPEFIPQNVFAKMDDDEQDEYLDQICDDRIGGVPFFFAGDEWPENNPKEWKLLLQLNGYGDLNLNFAEGQMFAFISNDFKRGGLLIQD
jgi:hypothetical protein